VETETVHRILVVKANTRKETHQGKTAVNGGKAASAKGGNRSSRKKGGTYQGGVDDGKKSTDGEETRANRFIKTVATLLDMSKSLACLED